MPNILDDLYHSVYKPKEFSERKDSIEENHKILIGHLTKEDRKLVLRIIAAEVWGRNIGINYKLQQNSYNNKREMASARCLFSFVNERTFKSCKFTNLLLFLEKFQYHFCLKFSCELSFPHFIWTFFHGSFLPFIISSSLRNWKILSCFMGT